ncbi:type VI secretion protein VasK [Trinickia terrae]|uniref:Type VI secretion protein VasK n=1 Tax=Trinickia terrae TaxID=2571161 RepID=A0A4U1HHE2_9BURK|nr:ImcF-related family protein [Trinickia terrae]TKC78927.1 type VI secretion protein VasK [Trinickia terrae]
MSKEELNENASAKVLIFLGLALAALFTGLWMWMSNEEPPHGWFANNRKFMAAVLVAAWLACMFLAALYELGVREFVADSRVARFFDRRRKDKHESTEPVEETHTPETDALRLRQRLQTRHGRFWRYRDRWILVAGDDPLVKRLAPGLAETGYAITGGTVLLHANQTRDTLDTAWLDQIRRMRRRRPIDAIVAVTRNRTSAKAPSFDTDDISQRLARHARALRWSAPAYVLNVTDFGDESSTPDEPIGFTWQEPRIQPETFEATLSNLTFNLADEGVARLAKDGKDRYPAELSQHISRLHEALSDLVTQTSQSRYWRQAVHGLLFAPLFKERELAPPAAANGPNDDNESTQPQPQQRTTWQTIADHSRTVHGRRVGVSLSTAAAWTATAAIGVWTAGMLLSGATNRATIQSAEDTLDKLSTTQDRTQSALALDSLQKQIDTLETHQRAGAPWTTRFGLNRDAALIAALWPGYEHAAVRILAAPIKQKLEEKMRQLASLPDAEIASGGNAQVQAAYDTLKTYLMLAYPARANTAFLTPQLIAAAMPARPQNASLSPGAWEDLRQRLLAFYASHLNQRPTASGSSQAIVLDGPLVAATRESIIGVRGIQNSTDAIYQQIIDEAQPKYPPVSLATLLGSTTSRGLFNTTATVPGVFTRAAWDDRISKAIDDASEQHAVAGDWVLSDAKPGTDAEPSTLKDELRRRYFADYARAWEQFLNSLRWQSATTLSGTVDQLSLLGDSQRSPLVALMNAIVYQAGTGASVQSLSDTLINKAQKLVGADEKDPSKQAQLPQAPLAAAFGPILRLAGSDLTLAAPTDGKNAAQQAATGDLSLARYLERVTAMRLKVQQMVSNPDPDAMSRIAAQAVLQGKTSDIADSRDYASRVAASLGERWSGFGDALFQRPLDQTWDVVLQPAAASLNDTWRTAIVADWNKAFGGRYPFADSDNDASIAELTRFLRADNGVIAQFVSTQLAGVVERQGDRWALVQGAGRNALTVDPAFLASLNRLARVSNVLFPSGDAHVRYELRAAPTPGITEMTFKLSGRELHYFNQKQEWTPFLWPGEALENNAHVEWQSQESGLRSSFDFEGRFGLIRLLEKADVAQQDNARYQLKWMPDQSTGLPLQVQLRSEAGGGPLEALTLRHFTLPPQIFIVSRGAAKRTGASASSPPPLPAAMLESARHAQTPLPSNGLPDYN